MNNLAACFIEGNLTHDPESRTTKNGKVVTSFSVAVNHDYSGKDGGEFVSYFNVETWDRLAESCRDYLKKGRGVLIQGVLRQDRWKDDQGVNHSRVKIMANQVRFENKKSANQENGREKQDQAA